MQPLTGTVEQIASFCTLAAPDDAPDYAFFTVHCAFALPVRDLLAMRWNKVSRGMLVVA
jgi:hypothetical protein